MSRESYPNWKDAILSTRQEYLARELICPECKYELYEDLIQRVLICGKCQTRIFLNEPKEDRR